eukprot:3342361-Amphidinium_carterae.1
MNKLKIITCNCKEEAEANRRRAIAEQEAVEQTVREAGNATRHITAEALSQLDDNPKKRSKLDVEVCSEVEGGSSNRLKEVDKFLLDVSALETHAAQFAASQFLDGSAPSAPLHQQRNANSRKAINSHQLPSSMPTVLKKEAAPPPSDQGSHRSAWKMSRVSPFRKNRRPVTVKESICPCPRHPSLLRHKGIQLIYLSICPCP